MILVGLAVLFGIAVLLKEAYDWSERVAIILLGGSLGIILWVFASMILSFLVNLPLHKTYSTERKDLTILQDGTQTTGSFFLGIGSFDGEQKYSYYVSQNGGSKLEQTKADTVTVYQDSEEAYLLQQTYCKTSADWLTFCVSDGRVTEIHVPKNTIKQNFVLDAK